MSKLKRKWIKVIEAEETGEPLDESTRAQVMETHPNLPILSQQPAPQAPMVQPPATQLKQAHPGMQDPDAPQRTQQSSPQQLHSHPHPQLQQHETPYPQHSPYPQQRQRTESPAYAQLPPSPYPQHQQNNASPYPRQSRHVPSPYSQQQHNGSPYPQLQQTEPQIDARLLQPHLQTDSRLQSYQIGPGHYMQPPQHQIDSQLEHQLQREIASAGAQRM